jgi:hypothetical protein
MAYQRHIGLAPILRSNSGKPFLLEFDMKTIPLTQGKFAIVDDEDYKELSKHKWYASKSNKKNKTIRFYAQRGRKPIIKMHREIMGLNKGDKKEIDHRNHDSLDNRKCNLRVCTSIENSYNKRPNGTSKYKGIYWWNNKWVSTIRANGRAIYLGRFETEKEAAITYNNAAKKYFGEFAYLNVMGADND